jgi:hypothetical protein
MTLCNMMGYPMLEIFGSAPPEVITTFFVPRKAPQHLYIMCIFLFKLFFQFLNSWCVSWWVFSNEAVRFEHSFIGISPRLEYPTMPPAGSLKVFCAPARWVGI